MAMNSSFHYNYVYFNSSCNGNEIDPNEYNAICTRDLESLDNVRVIQVPLQNKSKFWRSLFNIHNDERINRRINLPLKNVWFPYYFKDDFNNQRPYCFVFASTSYSFEYIDFLRKKYPNCKIVKIHRDLLKVTHAKPNFTEENMNRVFDLRLTIDEEEAKKYNLLHFDEIESKIDISIDPNYPLSDVFFAGKAKDRLPKLIEAYDRLTSFGLKCDFFITHVRPEDQIQREGIIYSDKYMPYIDMLYKSVNSRFMFDINQAGALGYTSRFLEAVIYNKRFITDNKAVKDTRFYSTGDILVFDDVSDIEKTFFEKSDADYKYTGEFSPIHLIEIIDRELVKQAMD